MTTSSTRTRQIIRYQATVTLRRPRIKQYATSNEGGGVQNQREHHIILILTKYGVVHPTAVSENNSYKYNKQGPTTSEHYRRHKKFDYTYVADRLRLLS